MGGTPAAMATTAIHTNHYSVGRYNDGSLARPAPICSLERQLNGLPEKGFTSNRVKTGTVQIGSFFHRFHGIRHLLGTCSALAVRTIPRLPRRTSGTASAPRLPRPRAMSPTRN